MSIEITETEDDAQRIETRTETFFDKLVLYIAMGLFVSTLVLATIQVLVRNIPILPIEYFFWTAPLARIIFIVMTYFGAAVAARNSEHISIQLVLDQVAQRAPRVTLLMSILSTSIVIIVTTVAVIGVAILTIERWGQVIGGIDIGHYGFVYLGITLALSATLLYYMLQFVSDVNQAYTAGATFEDEFNTREN